MKHDDERRLGRENKALSEALRATQLQKRKPTDADAVPAWKAPMTKAQRIALRLPRRVYRPPLDSNPSRQ